jgi:hypothetical protein
MSAEYLTSLPEVCYRSERVRLDIPFPSWVETENIGVNLPKTERLMNIGGIKHLRVVGEVNGERTVSMPQSIGVAPDGSKYAGMLGAKEASKSMSLESNIQKTGMIFRNAEWTSTVLHLNLEEIQRQIEEKKGNLRKADSWTPHLDNALRQGVRQAGNEYLLTHFSGIQKFFIIWSNLSIAFGSSTILGTVTESKPIIPAVVSLSFNVMLSFALWTLAESFFYGRENGKEGSGYRVSLFPGYEIDRAAILQVLSRTNKLVKPITPKNK